jgi:predicted acyl esterase
MLRARYRQSLRFEQLIVPGEINPYVFDGFTFFSRRIMKGSRLRLIIACPNSIYYQKNYNSGGVVSNETNVDAQVAHIDLYHDANHQSYLEIPIAR